MIDFEQVTINESALYYILPGQVHHRVTGEVAKGWYLAADTLLISPGYRSIFEDQLILQQPFLLTPAQVKQCSSLLGLIEEKHNEAEQCPFQLQIVHSLLQSFAGIVAGCYSELKNLQHKASRPTQLARQFKKLLTSSIHTVKSPSAYASMLNVSESYLNESLKKITGFSVSYWITNEVMLEARRLLYYSDLNVKEIAHTIGYEDHAYFSRLFKRAARVTPLAFRKGYRK
jgi:AraC-like DNA-binding protein